ncbi:hypothetical protein GEMRC1_001156 [Eukaryota sp. GEM-RC1]
MPTLNVSAPAKVILAGEHAAVYGLNAIAAATSMRTTVTLFPISSNLPHRLKISFDQYSSEIDTEKLIPCIPSKLSLADSSIQQSILRLAPVVPHDLSDVRPIVVTLLLLTHISLSTSNISPTDLSLDITISSDIPQSIGLGSSSALCTSLAASFLCWFGKIGVFPEDKDIEAVCKWSRLGEIVFHGTPSGIDTSTSALGGFVLIEKHQPLLIVDSTRQRPQGGTAAAVSLVERNIREDKKKLLALERINVVVGKLIASSPHGLSLPELAELFNDNHLLLTEIGVGFEEAEDIRSICSQFGYSAKITGAGLGGCLLAIPTSLTLESDSVSTALKDRGYKVYKSTLGGAGLDINLIS